LDENVRPDVRGRPPASAFTRGCCKKCVHAVKIVSAWTHKCVRADMVRPCGRKNASAQTPMSARTLGCVCPHMGVRADAPPSPPLSLPPLCCPRGREKIKIQIILKFFFYKKLKIFGSFCQLRKREKI
jgi:hypothetical protein